MNAIAKIAIVTIVYAQIFANFGHLVPYISGAQCAVFGMQCRSLYVIRMCNNDYFPQFGEISESANASRSRRGVE